jgi:hypothetical protein
MQNACTLAKCGHRDCTLLHSGNNHVIYADQQILWRRAGLLGVSSAVEYRVRELTRFANALDSHQ